MRCESATAQCLIYLAVSHISRSQPERGGEVAIGSADRVLDSVWKRHFTVRQDEIRIQKLYNVTRSEDLRVSG